MIHQAVSFLSTAPSPSTHLEPDNTHFDCFVSLRSRRSSRLFPYFMESLCDLVLLRRHMANWLSSDAWALAASLVGERLSSIATALVLADDSGFSQEVAVQFRPFRFNGRSAPTKDLSPMDLAIRAVAAHAVLGRFCAYLDYVRRMPLPGVNRNVEQLASTDDLLAAMAKAHRETLAIRGARKTHRCNSRKKQPDRLSELVQREAEARLGMETGNRQLAKRVRKHMHIFRDLARLLG